MVELDIVKGFDLLITVEQTHLHPCLEHRFLVSKI